MTNQSTLKNIAVIHDPQVDQNLVDKVKVSLEARGNPIVQLAIATAVQLGNLQGGTNRDDVIYGVENGRVGTRQYPSLKPYEVSLRIQGSRTNYTSSAS